MSDTDYLVKVGAGNAFVKPVHPGDTPVSAGGTSAQINEAYRVYDTALRAHTTYMTTGAQLKAQMFLAVDPMYLAILEDAKFGFADVSVAAMLAHLWCCF
jgi:hypothetical protein